MRPPESFIGQPIRSLQTMLRVIAEDDPRHTTLVPDGIYGPETMGAVFIFQSIHDLPPRASQTNQPGKPLSPSMIPRRSAGAKQNPYN